MAQWLCQESEFDHLDALIETVRETHFTRIAGTTYLDHAGATLYSEVHMSNWQRDLASNVYGNPHSHSTSSQRTTEAIENIRTTVLQYFNTSSDQYSVVFTSNCSAALKLVAESFMLAGNTRDTLPQYTSGRTEDKRLHRLNSCGIFAYLNDNHTSVVGMREVLVERGAEFVCLTAEDVKKELAILLKGCKASSNKANGYHEMKNNEIEGIKACTSNDFNNLYAFPAQSNFSGERYPLQWISGVGGKDSGFLGRGGGWFTLLDAASYLTTSLLDLSEHRPDFVVLSFYKIFGFPTGLGALLVRKQSEWVLKKTYFGGGTIEVSLPGERFHAHRKQLEQRFEDGTLPFLEILSLKHGFDFIQSLAASIQNISSHTFLLAQRVYRQLATLRHYNGQRLAVVYETTGFSSPHAQGPIVNFNLLTSDGSFIGFSQVGRLAELYKIDVRTGCFCNIGACQQHLGLTSQRVKDNFKAGHVCGDSVDIIEGLPTGSVRISFGVSSTMTDAHRLLRFLTECFLESSPPPRGAPLVSSPLPQGAPRVKTDPRDELTVKSLPNGVRGLNGRCLECVGVEEKGVGGGGLVECRMDGGVRMELLSIHIYPVKSCAGVEIRQSFICSRGLLYDRRWMIVSGGSCLTQKREPRLCLIVPCIDEQTNQLILSSEGFDDIRLPLCLAEGTEGISVVCHSQVCADGVVGLDCGEGAAAWCQAVLDRPGLRLMQQSTEDNRTCRVKTRRRRGNDLSHCPNDDLMSSSINGNASGFDALVESRIGSELSLANEAQYLLIGSASLDALLAVMQQRYMQSNNSDDLINRDELVKRFRPNFVVQTGEVFVETTWRTIQIGRQTFLNEGPCSRCQMICVDQMTGSRTKEPLRSLATMPELKNSFGILLRWLPANNVAPAMPTSHSSDGDAVPDNSNQGSSTRYRLSVGDVVTPSAVTQ